MKKLLIFIFLAFIFLTHAYSDESTNTSPKPYDKSELPQGIKDLRRFEIITLGSLPFVTLDTSIVYSTIRYAQHNFDNNYFPDLFTKSNYTQEEQAGIILTSVGISVGIGLTDLIVQIIKRSNKKKKEKQITYDDISIVPISEDPDASQIPLPQEQTDNQNINDDSNNLYNANEVQEIEE